jgi:hypothetical protein
MRNWLQSQVIAGNVWSVFRLFSSGPARAGLSSLAIVTIGCTISSGRSNRAPNANQPSGPYPNQPPPGYYYNQQPGPYANQPPSGPYAQNPTPAPNGYPQQPPHSSGPAAQYNPPVAPLGLCASLHHRENACPSEGSVGGCDNEERCLTGVSRPDAIAMLSDCVQRSPCNIAPNIVEYCAAQLRQRLTPTRQTLQLVSVCSTAATQCPDKVADKCASAHLLSDAVAGQVAQCLLVPDCRAKDQCVERVYESRGCP